VREGLRHLGEPEGCLATLQYTEAAQQAGEEPAQIERVVAEWLHQRPLKYLWLCRRRGLEGFITFLESKSVEVGVFSDYPALDKLEALGLAGRISLALCTTDPAINAFKPHPKGFLHACTFWGLSPEEVLYIGDRPEVDAVGAANAGMPCALLRTRVSVSSYSHFSDNYIVFSSFTGLQHALSAYC
jgi:HAD superfamily hydrolase (TIGR01549 family)